jgi:glutamyl/glutaminyl-tRNA synthetase
MREIQQINKQPTGYFGGSWRDAAQEKVAEMEGKPFVVRQRVPRGQKIVTEDFVRGRVEFDSDNLPDPVLIKADGMPTYHFAAMVDDHLMEITHVLRGEEWLSSAPFHSLLFDQLGWDKPVFVHCPVIVGTDGKKLSKRHGATRVLDYAAHGVLKGALKNFIALIGWSPGNDQEIFTQDELTAAFDLRGLQPSPGRFDLDKLRWQNGHAIRQLSPEKLLATLLEFIDDPYTTEYWTNTSGLEPSEGPQLGVPDAHVLERLRRIKEAAVLDRVYVLAALKETQERANSLVEFGEAMEFFLVDEPPLVPSAAEKWLSQEHVPELFEWILARLAESRIETAEHYESILRGYQTHKGFEKLGPVVHPTRVALTGKTTGPGLFELMAVLGHDRIAKRLRRSLELGRQ